MFGTLLIRALMPAPRHRLRALSLLLAAYLALGQAVLPVIEPSYADWLPYHGHLSLSGPVSPSHLHAHDIGAIDDLSSDEPRMQDDSGPGDVVSFSNASATMQAFASLQGSTASAVDVPWPVLLTVAFAPSGVRVLAGRTPVGSDRPPAVS